MFLFCACALAQEVTSFVPPRFVAGSGDVTLAIKGDGLSAAGHFEAKGPNDSAFTNLMGTFNPNSTEFDTTIPAAFLLYSGQLEIDYVDSGGRTIPYHLDIDVLPATPNSGQTGDPILTASGEVTEETVDMSLGGPIPVRFTRYYGSLNTSRALALTSALGTNWTHNFDIRMTVNLASRVFVNLPRGKSVRFNGTPAQWTLPNQETVAYQLVSQNGGYRFLDPSENRIYTFSSAGALTRIEDRNGNAISVTQSAAGPTQISDGLGRTIVFTYSGNTLVSVDDQNGRKISFGRTGKDLTSVTDAMGHVTQYQYAASGLRTGLLAVKTLPTGVKPFTQTYDTTGRAIQQTDSRANATRIQFGSDSATITTPLNSTYQHVHDAAGNLVSFTDTAGQKGSLAYDAANGLIAITDRLGDKSSFTYHAPSGQLASFTNALGRTTTLNYSTQTQGSFTFYVLSSIQSADGSQTSVSYDAVGNAISKTDPAGSVTSYTYNSAGQLVTETNPQGGITTRSYNSDSTLAASVDPSGNKTSYSYDLHKRLMKITHPDQTVRQFTYDDNDNLLSATDERGVTVRAAVDDNNHRVSTTSGEGGTAKLTLDGDQRPAMFTDPLGNSGPIVFDELGRLKTVIAPTGDIVRFSYDAAGKLASLKGCDDKGLSFTNDATGVLSSVTDALGRSWTTTSDKQGHITRITTPLGRTFDIGYDTLDRVVSRAEVAGQPVTYKLDARGNVAGATAPGNLTASFTTNERGQITDLTDAAGGHWLRAFDPQGRLTSATDPLGRKTTFTFDSRNRLTKLVSGEGEFDLTYDAGNVPVAFQYGGASLTQTLDKDNRLFQGTGFSAAYDKFGSMIQSNGIANTRDASSRISTVTLAPGKAVKYVWDCRSLLTQVVDWLGGKTDFAYDDARQLISVTRPNGIVTKYTYDGDGRLTGIVEQAKSNLSSIALTRDAAGRITSAQRDTPLSQSAAPGTQAFAYDSANQINGEQFDKLGRPVSLGGRSYVWDLASHLTSYSGPDGSASFGYDVRGARIARTATGVTQSFVVNYAFRNPAISVVRTGTADQRYYIHTPDGLLLYSVEATGDARHFYHFDEMGSTVFLSDDSGTITDRYGITPYGEQTTHVGVTDNPFTFLGAFGVMQEGSTGLYWMGSRFYESSTARFLSPGAAGGTNPAALNAYQFAFQNPLFWSDPGARGSSAGDPSKRWTNNRAESDMTRFMLGLPDVLRTPREPVDLLLPRLARAVLDFVEGPMLVNTAKGVQ